MPVRTEQRPTAAYVDLDAVARNFHAVKEFVGSDLSYMAVVKANAYGHGLTPCALRLESEGVDWFGVALPEEGVELREAGIKIPILCLGSFWPGQERLVVENELTPVIYQFDIAESLNNYAAEYGLTIDIHVKIDTGMGRVGVHYSDAEDFATALGQLENLRIGGLLTHFAAAENPVENEFTELQMVRFAAACEAFRTAGHTPEWIDMANSPGAIRHPGSRGNLVRLGGALYGLLGDILSSDTVGPELEPVLSLRSKIAHIKKVGPGQSIGYGRTFVTGSETAIALVPIGYADGFPRSLSNCGKVAINGLIAPVIGRISMDWTLADVSDIAGVKVGDEVVLIGAEVTAVDIARATGTIAYEITCGLSPRVPRIYE